MIIILFWKPQNTFDLNVPFSMYPIWKETSSYKKEKVIRPFKKYYSKSLHFMQHLIQLVHAFTEMNPPVLHSHLSQSQDQEAFALPAADL